MKISSPPKMLLTAHSFFQIWKNICEREKNELLGKWCSARDYTTCVFPLIKQVAEEVGMNYYKNYYSLDAVFYFDEDRVPEIPNWNTWLRRIRVAVEHENSFYSGLFQVVSHLLITDCDLRVLITYPEDEDDLTAEFDRLQIPMRTSRPFLLM